MDDKYCPTCPGNKPQRFRPATKKELEYVAAHGGGKDTPSFWRCGNDGCLWVQPYFNRSKGFSLPESFR
ncbi:hypothetical protein ABZV31_31070 [Streptomyces sp. NPDC005202]|uniref:hypothetical protein n=1 Tax=Streptomyces sp. NPDC005202 TaxID=3157021 RepID=UPI0033B81BED